MASPFSGIKTPARLQVSRRSLNRKAESGVGYNAASGINAYLPAPGDYLEFHYFPNNVSRKVSYTWNARPKARGGKPLVREGGQKPIQVAIKDLLFNEWGDGQFQKFNSRNKVNTISKSSAKKGTKGYFNVQDSLTLLEYFSTAFPVKISTKKTTQFTLKHPPILELFGIFPAPFTCVIKDLSIRPVAWTDSNEDGGFFSEKKIIRAFVDINFLQVESRFYNQISKLNKNG